MARTTISVPDDLYEHLESSAKLEKISTNAAIRAAVREYVEARKGAKSNGLTNAVDEARQTMAVTRRFTNPYQDLVASWRLSRTLRQLDGVASYRLDLEAWPAGIYLMKVLAELMRKFDDRDEFLTITNFRFWNAETSTSAADVEPTYEHFYLKAQEDAIQNGMRLHRIFLVTADDLKTPARMLQPHREFLARVRRAHADRVQVSYVECASLQDGLRQFGHFACVRRYWKSGAAVEPVAGACGCLIVEPMYDALARITTLRFVFSRGPGDADPDTKFYIDRFAQAARMKHDLERIGA
jgi:hypothetical protein